MNGHILNDQQNTPMNYYLDKWNFVNNTIEKFFGSTQIAKEPSLFRCNFIFNEKSIASFNFNVNLELCYFSNSIEQTSINYISTPNDIEVQFEECKIHNCNSFRIRYSSFSNSNIMILVSLFLFQ